MDDSLRIGLTGLNEVTGALVNPLETISVTLQLLDNADDMGLLNSEITASACVLSLLGAGDEDDIPEEFKAGFAALKMYHETRIQFFGHRAAGTQTSVTQHDVLVACLDLLTEFNENSPEDLDMAGQLQLRILETKPAAA